MKQKLSRRFVLQTLTKGMVLVVGSGSAELLVASSAFAKKKKRRSPSIPRYGVIKRWHGEKPIYGFGVEMPPDAASILSDYGSKYNTRGAKRTIAMGDHPAIDIASPLGTPVIAAHPGTVDQSLNHSFNGNFITIIQGELETSYWHLQRRLVKKGQKVERGDIIGTVGKTGSSAGPLPHLHYEARDRWGGKDIPHKYWIGSDESLINYLPGNKTDARARIVLFEPGKEYLTEYMSIQIATYPIPGKNELPYFLKKLKKLKRVR